MKSIDSIINYKEVWKLLGDMNTALLQLEKINQINLRLSFSTGFDWLSDDKKQKFLKILIEFISSSYDSIKESIYKYNLIAPPDQLHDPTGHKQQGFGTNRIAILLQMSLIIWNWTDASSEFCVRFHELNGVRTIFKFINDNSFLFHLIEKLKQQSQQWNLNNQQRCSGISKYVSIYKTLKLAFKSFLGCIHNLSKFSHMFSAIWSEVDACASLFKLIKLILDESNAVDLMDIDLITYMAMVRLVKKKSDLEPFTDKFLRNIFELIEISGKKLALNEPIERKMYKLDDHLEMQSILIVSSVEKTKWRLTELIEALITLADLNEPLKPDMFQVGEASLKQILFNGNEVEKEFVLRLIWKFCFDPDLLKNIRQDVALSSFILGLSLNHNLRNKNLFKYCNLILYFLNGNQFHVKITANGGV